MELYFQTPNKSSWRGTQLSTGRTLHLPYLEVYFILNYSQIYFTLIIRCYLVWELCFPLQVFKYSHNGNIKEQKGTCLIVLP